MLHKAITWLMLIYLVVYVIPPISAFAGPGILTPSKERPLSIQTHSQQARLLLVDLLVWQQITQTKRSESVTSISGLAHGYDDKETNTILEKVVDIIAEAVHIDENRFIWIESQQAVPARYHLAYILYSHSGISPPQNL